MTFFELPDQLPPQFERTVVGDMRLALSGAGSMSNAERTLTRQWFTGRTPGAPEFAYLCKSEAGWYVADSDGEPIGPSCSDYRDAIWQWPRS